MARPILTRASSPHKYTYVYKQCLEWNLVDIRRDLRRTLSNKVNKCWKSVSITRRPTYACTYVFTYGRILMVDDLRSHHLSKLL